MAHSAVYARNRHDLNAAQRVDDKGLTVAQVAGLLECSRSTVYNLMDSGQISFYKIGTSQGKRIRRSEVDRYKAEREEEV